MRLNSSTQIISDKVVLVPYRKELVPKYHKWMENEKLREQTASERLTLEEEYAMQQTWLHDENKCTFIALDKETMARTNDESDRRLTFEDGEEEMRVIVLQPYHPDDTLTPAKSASDNKNKPVARYLRAMHRLDAAESMIGDANLYLNSNQNDDGASQLTGEVGLMVADPRFCGRGFGKEMALCLIRYGIQSIGVQRFQAIISMQNEISVSMFEKLKFVKESASEVFEEVTLSRIVDNDFIEFVEKSTPHYQECSTRPNE